MTDKKKVYVFFADGCEETEGLATVDILRRAGLDTVMVSVRDTKENSAEKDCKCITGAHGIRFLADGCFSDFDYQDGTALVLPGGMPGTKHLAAHKGLCEILRSYTAQKKLVTAICAAPTVLAKYGLLDNVHATCFPGFEKDMTGALVSSAPVEVQANIITGKAMGTVMDFALEIAAYLCGREQAEKLRAGIYYKE